MAETLTIRTASSTEVVKIAVPGPQGPAGQGVPVGGSTGQVLRKASGSDYDTEWAAAGSGSGSVTSVALASTDLTISGSPITDSGTITANIAANAVTLEKLQTISSEHLLGRHGSGNGGVQQIGLGTGLAISGSNVRVATTGITAGTYTKLTLDETGRATVGATATPSDIGAQSLFETQNLTLTTDIELTANRAKQYNVIRLNSLTITLPTTGHLTGDIVVIYNIPAGSGTLTIRRGGASESFWTLAAAEQLRWRATGTGASDWELVRVDSHSADRITSGTLDIARIPTGTSSSTVCIGNDSRLSDSRTPTAHAASHASAGSDPLTLDASQVVATQSGGIGSAWGEGESLVDVFTNVGNAIYSNQEDFAAASHTHAASDITSGSFGNISHDGKLGSTAGLPVVTTTSGAVTTLALGTAGQVLTVNSGATGVEFAAASGGGVSAVNSTLADILSVSGSDLVADDLGADKLYGFDDSEGKAIGFTIGSGLSVSGDTLSATATGTIGGSTGSTDNSLLRSDGTGGSTAQASALVVDDAVVTFTGITGDAGTDIITATGSAFSNGQRVRFTALTGGSGLNTTTNYFVINASGATFQVSTSEGGAASLFTTNITAGTLLTGHSVSPHVAIRNNSSDTNSVMVIAPKGTGALVAQIPDGTTTGGNARGANAVDLQTARITATAVASGQYAAIAGGYRNTASALSSSVGGGEINTASNSYSRVGGGKSNTASGAGSIVGGGENISATGEYSAVVGGYGNSASGQSSFVGGGGYWSPTTIANTASATFSSVLGGQAAIADRLGFQAHANGRFAANGDAQRFRAVLRCKTTTNSAVEMALDGNTTYLTIPSGKVIFCNIKVVGVKSDGSVVATYERQYAAKNVAGTSSEVYAAVTIGADNASSTSLEVATVDAGDYIRIRPTGIASETWRWVASVDAVEVAYGT